LETNAAVQVVPDRAHDEDDEQCGEHPTDCEAFERQPEDVEPDVLVELRILDVEVGRVGKQDPALPFGRDAAAHHDREEDGHEHAHAPCVRRDIAAIPLDDLVFGTGSAVTRRDAIRDDQVDEHHHEERSREDQRGHGLGRQELTPRLRETDVLEPQVIGVKACEPSEAQQQNDEEDRNADQPAA
jgi:hypothetical protein